MSEGELETFVTAVNLGVEPRRSLSYEPWLGSFYLRKGDEAKPAIGKPSLSNHLISQILDEPLTANITSIEIENDKFPEVKVATIDRGKKDGLREEMPLVSENDDGMDLRTFPIISITDNSAKVRIYIDLKVGERLTTKAKKIMSLF